MKKTRYMSDETQTELMKQIFIQETHSKKKPVIRTDFAEWLGLEDAVFWIASSCVAWDYLENSSLEEFTELVAENLIILHKVFGTELEVLYHLAMVEFREIREEELREIEENQKGKILS